MLTRLHGKPVLALMSASSGAMMYYTGGVINDGCFAEEPLDHPVLVVGYDEKRNIWKAQNNWGESWGMQGYFEIVYGENMCGIESYPLVPELY